MCTSKPIILILHFKMIRLIQYRGFVESRKMNLFFVCFYGELPLFKENKVVNTIGYHFKPIF